VPYSQEINDLPAIVGRHQEAEAFSAMIEVAVAQLLEESSRRAAVLGIALQPYIMGQAHRVPALARALRRLRDAGDHRNWWTTAVAVAEHVEAIGAAV
jgi:ATP-dependent Clp protease ATP-binding subunit ClpA